MFCSSCLYIAFTQSGIISGNLFKYLKIIVTARELFKQFGCSERLYRAVLDPLLQVGLFAPSEQCSAAAILGMLNYYIIANQVRTIWFFFLDFAQAYTFSTRYTIKQIEAQTKKHFIMQKGISHSTPLIKFSLSPCNERRLLNWCRKILIQSGVAEQLRRKSFCRG